MGKAYADEDAPECDSQSSRTASAHPSKSALRYDKTLSHPHFVLCNLEKERNPAAARRACKAYLKSAPEGDYAGEAKELLRSL